MEAGKSLNLARFIGLKYQGINSVPGRWFKIGV